MSCINSANLLYDGVNKNFQISVENPVLSCPCNLLNLTTAKPKPPSKKNNIFVVSILDGKSLVSHPYNDGSYNQIMKFNVNH